MPYESINTSDPTWKQRKDRAWQSAVASLDAQVVAAFGRLAVNVKDPAYGAVGDGITDDTAAIQAAISAAALDTLYIPAGVYLVSATLVVSLPTIIIGDGQTKSIIKSNALSSTILRVDVDGVLSGFEFRHFGLDSTAVKTGGIGIHFKAVDAAAGLFWVYLNDIEMSERMWDGFNMEVGINVWLTRVIIKQIALNKTGFTLAGQSLTQKIVDVRMSECLVNFGTTASTFSVGLLINSYCEGVYADRCIFAGAGITNDIWIRNTLAAARPPENLFFSNCIFDIPGGASLLVDDTFTLHFENCWFVSSLDKGAVLLGGLDISFNNCTFGSNARNGVQVSSGVTQLRFNSCIFDANGTASSNTWSHILINANTTDFSVIGCDFRRGVGLTIWSKNCVEIVAGTSDRYIIANNNLTGFLASAVSDGGSGTDKVIRDNVGYITENSGTGSISSGSTSATVTHGLAATPAAKDISITLTENPDNDPGNIWVDTITSTQFNVNCRSDPGASNLDFAWRAGILP